MHYFIHLCQNIETLEDGNEDPAVCLYGSVIIINTYNKIQIS